MLPSYITIKKSSKRFKDSLICTLHKTFTVRIKDRHDSHDGGERISFPGLM